MKTVISIVFLVGSDVYKCIPKVFTKPFDGFQLQAIIHMEW